MDDGIFSRSAWAAMGLSGPEPEPPGTEDASVWPFVLLSIIIVLSCVFDFGKEMVEHSTPETFKPIVEAFFSELATLGFIGALAFLLTYNFSSSCEGPCSIMQQISEHFLGEPDELQEIFEKLHFLLFAVSVVFIAVVLVLLRISLRSGKLWFMWEESLKEANDAMNKDIASVQEDECQAARNKMLLQSVTRVQQLMDDQPEVKRERKWWWEAPDSLWFEWMKPQAQLRAEYYRIRHRFIDDEDEIVETQMDPDFDFCHYLKLSLAHTFAEVIEIKPVDWLVLWLGFAAVFALYFMEPLWTIWSFLAVEVIVMFLCLITQAKLVKIRFNLLPAVDQHSTRINASSQDFNLDDDASSITPLLAPSPAQGYSPTPDQQYRGAGREELDLIPREESDSSQFGRISTSVLMGPGSQGDLIPDLMRDPSGYDARLASPSASPTFDERENSNGARGGGNYAPPPGLTSAAPSKVAYRFQHPHPGAGARRGSSGNDTPRRLSREGPGMGVQSMASGRGGESLQSVNKGKMTAKTRISLARPLYTSLPTPKHVMSPTRQSSRKNMMPTPHQAASHGNVNRSHGDDEEDNSKKGNVVQRFLHILCCCFCCCCNHAPKIPTRHHTLFWFGIRGKGFMIHTVKLLLFSSVISLAVIAVELRTQLAEASLLLLVAAIVPPALTLIMTPRNLQLLNLVTSIEIMKKDELIVDVIKTQRYQKQRKVMQILSSLQFFLDQAEALTDTKSSTPKDIEYQFKKLQRDKSTKQHLQDLRELSATQAINSNLSPTSDLTSEPSAAFPRKT